MGKTPSWKDTFTFEVIGDEIIQMTIWDHDTVSSSDFIGEASISVDAIR